ncbi:MAG TPA: hypothetical protein VMH87_04545 [Pseudomonadales bacterium]|nr:hypothetical protein [Pseudomonadales bacterium]
MRTYCITTLIIFGFIATAVADETNYQSPIDGKSYQADWRTYHPMNPPEIKASTNRVQNQGIRLLSTQEQFSRSINVSELADFIRKTEHAIDSSLGATNNAFELVVQTTLTKDKKPFFEMASKGDVSQEMLQRIYDNFGRLPDYRSREDDLKYEVRFMIAKKP